MITLWASALAEEAAQVTEKVTEAAEETAAKADPTWAQEAVEKFTETPGTVWIALGVLVVIGIILLAIAKTSKKWTAKTVAFGALAIASAMNAAPLAFAIPVVIAASFLLLHLTENSKIKGDAAIALISTGSLAVGVMVVSMTTGMNTDVYNYLFGCILSMSQEDVALTGVVSAVILVLFVVFYHRIFAVTFDETFARATGMNAGLYNMVIALLTALVIVIGMRMMGSLLISSLVVFPAVTSMRTCITFRSVMICSAIVSAVCLVAGLVISYLYAAPTGASIVLCNIAAFILFTGVQKGRECLQSDRK